jgi:hypothetical protein
LGNWRVEVLRIEMRYFYCFIRFLQLDQWNLVKFFALLIPIGSWEKILG